MIGPGKYDEVCTLVRRRTAATLALVIVGEGTRGDGYSMQLSTKQGLHARVRALRAVVEVLRQVADQIEADLQHHSA